jgi:hypothetical protein
MHDLTVAEVHTYYVIAVGMPVLVHNCGGGSAATSASASAARRPRGEPGLWGGSFDEIGQNEAGGRWIMSVGDINQDDFAPFVNSALSRGDDVHILSGVHGYSDASLDADPDMYLDDARRFGNLPGVNVYNMSSMTRDEVERVLKGPGTIIGCFCNSKVCLKNVGGFPGDPT